MGLQLVGLLLICYNAQHKVQNKPRPKQKTLIVIAIGSIRHEPFQKLLVNRIF